MKLTVVGCSGSIPGPASSASCYLVEHDGVRIVLDLGSGALGALQRHVVLESIDAVLLSHLHADHCLDACAFVVWHRYSEHSGGPVPLYGPTGTEQRLMAAYFPGEAGLEDVFDIRIVSPASVVEIGGLAITFARVNHPVETHAIRVDCGSSVLTYSGDTGSCDELVRLAARSDVLLCEAAQPDLSGYPPELHLTGRQAGEHAAAADVGRLLLTHIPPWVDPEVQLSAAQSAFPAAELVRTDAVYEL